MNTTSLFLRMMLGTLLLSCSLAGCVVSMARAAEIGVAPPVIAVEGQPLAANIRRVLQALELLGQPLTTELSRELEAAATDRDADELQTLLDRKVLFVVAINPESRVKVMRGPAEAALQQAGFTPVLVKVINEGTVTGRLRIISPQAGPVYAGVVPLSLQRQQQQELGINQNKTGDKERFLSVEMFEAPPLTANLSGLEVEYAIALLYSHEAGQREATIGFELAGESQDLGFRGEVPVLFKVTPAVAVQLSIRDDDGRPTIGRLLIKDEQGRVYPTQAKRLAPDLFFQPHIYRVSGETVLLPPGKFTVEYSRGPEYRVLRREFTVPPSGPATVDLQLQRWIDQASHGFYSGDHHIHAAGCAHYSNPTEGVRPDDMFRQVKGEGLNVGAVLTWGPCYRFQRQFFEPQPAGLSEPLTVLKYDLEISGFGSQALGHVCLLNLRDQTFPGSDDSETHGWPTWTVPVLRWCKEQGGVTGYAHSASGLWIDERSASRRLMKRCDVSGDSELTPAETREALLPESFEKIDADQSGGISMIELMAAHSRAADQLPNLAIPEMNGVGAMELPVAVAEGVCDFISSMDTRRIQEWNTWYHVLNCGFPLKTSGETDFPCMSGRNVGQGRTYVQLGKVTQVDYAAWCEGLRSGKSYVSDGYAHAFDFRVNEVRPGEGNAELKSAETVRIAARVAFAEETPLAVAHGGVIPREGLRVSGDTVDLHGQRRDGMQRGGRRQVELIVNGQPVTSQEVEADGQLHDLQFNVPIAKSSWVALRHFPQLHTNPVSVIVAGQPIRASRNSARWCIDVINLLWQNRESRISELERPAARAAYDRALAKYQQIMAECTE